MDPSIIQALQRKQTVEELVPYRNIFRDMKNQKRQTEIMMYFHNVTLSVPASPTAPSNSSTSSTPPAPETARPIPPLPPPPQPTQHEDEDEYFYDDPFLLNE